MKRDKYVDIVKGICIILVVYVHIIFVTQKYANFIIFTQSIISQFFLTTFFIIGGFYLKNLDNAKEFMNNKVKKWYIKLIIYYIPFVLLHNIFIKIGIYEIDKIYNGKVTMMYSIETMMIKVIETLLLMGREPVLGAMWFFISQIIAMIGIIIISSIVAKISKRYKIDYTKIVFALLIIILIISTSLTELFDITIPRLSISASAMLLIYIGYYFNQKLKLKYDNSLIFFISILVIICNTIFSGRIKLDLNEIINPVTFLTSSIAGLYSLCFIAKKIEKFRISYILSECGKYSFQIMAFHLISFKPAMLIINKFKIENITVLSDLVPKTSNIIVFIIYILTGIIIPIMFTKLYDLVKKFIKDRKERK